MLFFMTPLYGHNSIETAYLVEDYPYGRHRCRIRFWLESNPKKGFRFCSQTEHPTLYRGSEKVWNAPKKSTYVKVAACMYLDDKGHTTWSGLSEYSGSAAALEFVKSFPGSDMSALRIFATMSAQYNQKGAEGAIVWRINGEAKPISEQDIENYKLTASQWEEVVKTLKTT